MKRLLITLGAALAVLMGLAPAASAQEVDNRVVLRPGDGITFTSQVPTPGFCSIAAIGYDDFDNLVAFTAGHCVINVGTNAAVWKVGEQSAGVIGRTTPVYSPGSTDFFGQPTTSKPDYAVINLDKTKVRGSNTSEPGPNGKTVVLNSIKTAPTGGNHGEFCASGHENADGHVECSSNGILVNSQFVNSWIGMTGGSSGGPLARQETGEWYAIATGYRPLEVPSAVYQRADKALAHADTFNSYGKGFELVTTP